MVDSWPKKDQNETLDYSIDWVKGRRDPVTDAFTPGPLAMGNGDTVVSSLWVLPQNAIDEGLLINSDSFTATVTTAWFTGGKDGSKYKITNRIVTSGGRTYDQSVTLPMGAK